MDSRTNYIQNLANDLKKYGKEYSKDEISSQLVSQIPWGTLVQIIFKNLANDLKEYGKGYSYEQLKKMARFANEFSSEEIGLQPATKIPWRTLVKILYKSNLKYEELFSQPERNT